MSYFFRFCAAAPRIRTLHTRCQTWREIWANGTVVSRLKSAEPCLKMAVSTGFCRTYSTVHKWRPLRVHFKFYVLFSPQTLNVESEVELCSRGNRCCKKAYNICVYICGWMWGKTFLFPHTDIQAFPQKVLVAQTSYVITDLVQPDCKHLRPLDTSPTAGPSAYRSRGTSSCGASCCSSGWIGCCTAHTWRASSPCVWPCGPAEHSSDWRPCHTDCTWRDARLHDTHGRWVWTQCSHN